MPTNKKKKGKKTAKSLEEELSTAASWGKGDNIVNAKSLAKNFPRMVAKLQDGTLDPDQLAKDLTILKPEKKEVSLKSYVREMRATAHSNNDDASMPPEERMLAMLSASLCENREPAEKVAFYQELAGEYYSNSCSPAAPVCQGEGGEDEGKDEEHIKGVVDRLQSSFHKIAGLWETRIQSFTGKPLKDTCKFYKMSREVFGRYYELEILQGIDMSRVEVDLESTREKIRELEEIQTTFTRIKDAAQSVVEGDHTLRSSCWECNKIYVEGDDDVVPMAKCSSCQVAKYCSRACQKRAWNSGHKKACRVLEEKYRSYLENKARIKKTVGDNRITVSPIVLFPRQSNQKEFHCFFKPVIAADFILASLIISAESLTADDNFKGHKGIIKGPSLDIFYENVARLASGGSHPLFRNQRPYATDVFVGLVTFEIEQLIKRGVNLQKIEKKEAHVMGIMSYFLSYDLSAVRNPRIIDRFTKFAEIKVSYFGTMALLERYLTWYIVQANMDNGNWSERTNTKSFQAYYQTQAFKAMKLSYHKMT